VAGFGSGRHDSGGTGDGAGSHPKGAKYAEGALVFWDSALPPHTLGLRGSACKKLELTLKRRGSS